MDMADVEGKYANCVNVRGNYEVGPADHLDLNLMSTLGPPMHPQTLATAEALQDARANQVLT